MASKTPLSSTPRVLSIQSHVVHGYVGNKCAVFSLQRLGFEVDPINAVQLSNHTGYPIFKGQFMDGAELQTILDGLEANGLLSSYTHLLTGYIGSVSLLQTIGHVVTRLRKENPDVQYVNDPVMGDDGRLYCHEELPPVYRDLIIPLASIITPNQYEAELLSGIDIHSVQDAIKACDELHRRGPHTVIITSLKLADFPDHVSIIASTTKYSQRCRYKLQVPRLHAYFTGTGDLMTALLLGWMHRYPEDLKRALETAVAGLQGVLRATAKAAEASGIDCSSSDRSADVCRARELRLVENQDVLSAPEVIYRAEMIMCLETR